jgi:hypothetical protein
VTQRAAFLAGQGHDERVILFESGQQDRQLLPDLLGLRDEAALGLVVHEDDVVLGEAQGERIKPSLLLLRL